MAKYQKQHYEDVAVFLHFYHDLDLDGPTAIAKLAEKFADLFAADNPPECSGFHTGSCLVMGGFDRERFLKACGLES